MFIYHGELAAVGSATLQVMNPMVNHASAGLGFQYFGDESRAVACRRAPHSVTSWLYPVPQRSEHPQLRAE